MNNYIGLDESHITLFTSQSCEQIYVTVRYDAEAVQILKQWLVDWDYPSEICHNWFVFHVLYAQDTTVLA